MIISHAHRFIFVKTTKTAGTSIEIALSAQCGPDDVITPITPEDEALRREYGGRGPQNTAIPLHRYRRHDWRTLLRQRRRARFYNHMPAADIRRYIGEDVWKRYFVFCFERNPFDKAISRYYWSTDDSHRPPMEVFLKEIPREQLSNWHLYTIGGELAVDFAGRYECLKADLEVIRQRIGLPAPLVLPHAKGSYRKDRRPYAEILSSEARRTISDVCRRELQEFNYTF